MISNPYEDVTKACEDAEAESAKLQIDFAVIMIRYTTNERNANPLYAGKYAIEAIVNLSELLFNDWQLMAIAKPSGLVYSWSKIQGYEEQT